jgi:CheY-like chemotaxis protein
VTSDDPCIAVVDDEVPVRTALGRLLRLADYEVATFGSGEEFLASLAARPPDCVILDVHMPGLSGYDVQSRLRAERIDVPVVFITASDDLTLDRTVSEAGGASAAPQAFFQRRAARCNRRGPSGQALQPVINVSRFRLSPQVFLRQRKICLKT